MYSFAQNRFPQHKSQRKPSTNRRHPAIRALLAFAILFSAPAAQSSLTGLLSIDPGDGHTGVAVEGEPVILTISLSNSSPNHDVTVNQLVITVKGITVHHKPVSWNIPYTKHSTADRIERISFVARESGLVEVTLDYTQNDSSTTTVLERRLYVAKPKYPRFDLNDGIVDYLVLSNDVGGLGLPARQPITVTGDRVMDFGKIQMEVTKVSATIVTSTEQKEYERSIKESARLWSLSIGEFEPGSSFEAAFTFEGEMTDESKNKLVERMNVNLNQFLIAEHDHDGNDRFSSARLAAYLSKNFSIADSVTLSGDKSLSRAYIDSYERWDWTTFGAFFGAIEFVATQPEEALNEMLSDFTQALYDEDDDEQQSSLMALQAQTQKTRSDTSLIGREIVDITPILESEDALGEFKNWANKVLSITNRDDLPEGAEENLQVENLVKSANAIKTWIEKTQDFRELVQTISVNERFSLSASTDPKHVRVIKIPELLSIDNSFILATRASDLRNLINVHTTLGPIFAKRSPKSFLQYISIAAGIGLLELGSESPIIGDASIYYVGLGVRLNRYVRFNTGLILWEHTDLGGDSGEEVIDQDFMGSFAVGISLSPEAFLWVIGQVGKFASQLAGSEKE